MTEKKYNFVYVLFFSINEIIKEKAIKYSIGLG